MKEQEYRIQKIDSFELADIFDCGQCFRWNKQENGSYTGVFKGNVMNVKKEQDEIIFKGICNGNIKDVVEEYFDLNRDYEKIKEQLKNIDENVKKSVEYGQGIRILNQDLWEMIISYIISANNNIPRIKGIIEKLNFGASCTLADVFTVPLSFVLCSAESILSDVNVLSVDEDPASVVSLPASSPSV